jgi:hypothetical protein
VYRSAGFFRSALPSASTTASDKPGTAARNVGDRLVQHLVHRRGHAAATKQLLPGQQLVEHDAAEKMSIRWSMPPPDSCSGAMYSTLPTHPAVLGELHVGLLGNAEIEQLHAAVLRDPDVRWLDVTVHDAVLVQTLQPFAHSG